MDVSTTDSVTLNALYNKIMTDLKNSSPFWEDFLSKSQKLHGAMRNVLQCSSIFWEAFQKIADLATDAQGATKEIGASLTRLCMRQKLIESKLKMLNNYLNSSLFNPVQERLEEWKRFIVQLDKDKLKETKKAKSDWKKASGESLRLQKKAVKRGSMRGLGSLQNQVEGALKNTADKFASLQYVESLSLRRAMTHERERFCFLFACMKPILDCQIGLFNDMGGLDELIKTLAANTASPDRLPVESEEIIQQIVEPDLRGPSKSNCNLSGNTVFSSGFGSRKSSVASLNSHQSLSSGSGPSTQSRYSQHNEMFKTIYGINGYVKSCKEVDTLERIDNFYKDLFEQRNDSTDGNFRASHISVTSSVQETSGCSGDYRMSDDDCKNAASEKDNSAEESDDEDEDGDDDDDDSEEEAKTPSSPATLWHERIDQTSPHGTKFVASRHTISGSTSHSRPALSLGIFEPLNKNEQLSNPSLTTIDQSNQLYPNQAIPLPVYTNLKELTNAAQRKFSMKAPSPEIEAAIMTTSVNVTNTSVIASVSPSGSKTPGVRRMTLPEVVIMDRQRAAEAVEINDRSPGQQNQTSTLTRQSEGHHYKCPQNTRNHTRSTSISDHTGALQNELMPNKNQTSNYMDPKQNRLIQELSQQIIRQKSVPGGMFIAEDDSTKWSEFDPELPMPPPPSTAEEEIRLASMPINNYQELILRHKYNQNSPNP